MSNREKMERMDQILQSSSVYNNPTVLKKKIPNKQLINEKNLSDDENIENLTVDDENIENLTIPVETLTDEEILSNDVDGIENLNIDEDSVDLLNDDSYVESLDVAENNETIESLSPELNLDNIDVLKDDTDIGSLSIDNNFDDVEKLDEAENNEITESLDLGFNLDNTNVLNDNINVENLSIDDNLVEEEKNEATESLPEPNLDNTDVLNNNINVENLSIDNNPVDVENLDVVKNNETTENLELRFNGENEKNESTEDLNSNELVNKTEEINNKNLDKQTVSELPKIEDKKQNQVALSLNDINKVVINDNAKANKEKTFRKSSKIYFGFGSRVATLIVLIVVFLTLLIVSTKKALFVSEGETANYKETSQLNYKICLKENDFYEEQCLGKDMKYVANLIDKIPIDFNYYFKIDKKSTLDFKYKIMGELIIADEQGKDVYFRKKYVLLEDKTDSIKESSDYSLKENLVIDYPYYNKLANDFKATYGLDTNSYLKVNLEVQKENKDPNSEVEIQKNNDMAITIPLSERAVNVKMNYKNINDVKQTLVKPKLQVSNIKYTIFAIISFIILIIIIIKLSKLLSLVETKKSKYDKLLNKILNEYDRLIVETETPPDLNINNIVKIKKFEELLDVRDNLRLPIMYFNVTKHQKSYFFIHSNNLIYLLVLKDVDLV